MALKFRKVQRKVLAGEDAGKVKTYAVAKASGYCDLQKLCKLISARSAMSSADVKAILDSLNWVMDVELQSGNIVQLGEFGNFRLTVCSEGTEQEKDFTAANITRARIVFTPGASLRQTNQGVSYEYDEPVIKTVKEDEEDPGGI